MQSKPAFKLLGKRSEQVIDSYGNRVTHHHAAYEAGFWEGPIEAGQTGRYVKRQCCDVATPVYRSEGGVCRPTGEYRFRGTGVNVSYYAELKKAVGL